MATTRIANNWYRVYQAAELLNIQPSAIYKWIKSGKIKRDHVKLLPTGTMIININDLLINRPARKLTENQLHGQSLRNRRK